MKKTYLLIAAIALVSCTKENVLTDNPTQQQTAQKANKSSITVTEPYTGQYYDSCRKENINLSGTSTYTLKGFSDSTGFYFSYDIDTKATGTGEVSGTDFHGGITLTATIKANGGNIKAMTSYKLKFVAATGEQLNFTQLVKLVVIDYQGELFFDKITNDCK